ncbi:MAG: hypothetical protein HY243_08615 [Proteobacteria bacterium]|nr:hypothetical protein [Pseudomonadota bacterium]
MRRVFLLIAGWGLVAIGIPLTFAPVPIPLIGVLPLLIGLAILTTHSKVVRRALQFTRHRYGWISRALEKFGQRAPPGVKTMVRRTRPGAILRYARRRARRGSI